MLENLKMHTTVEFNRPITKEDQISLGQFHMVTRSGKKLVFDFMGSEQEIDKSNPCICHVALSYPDFDAFPDFKDAKINDFLHISEIKEFFVYTGEAEELRPVWIQEIRFDLEFCCVHLLSAMSPVLRAYNEKLFGRIPEQAHANAVALGEGFESNTYLVSIKEERIRTIYVDSDSKFNACKKAHEMYCRGEIVLNDRDFHGIRVSAEEEEVADNNEYRADIVVERGIDTTLCSAYADSMEDLETEILYSIRDTMAAMESESCDFHMEATVYKNGVVQEERCRDGYYDKDRSTVILDVTKKPNKQLDKEARLDSEISYQEAGESKPCHPFDKHFWKPALENTCDGARLAKHNEEMECVHILVDNDMPAQELTCVLISPSHACAHFPTIQATTVAHTQMGVCQALGVDPYTHIKVRLLGDVMDDPTNSFVLLYPEVVTDKENTCVHELRDKKTGEAWQKIYGPMLILRRNGKTLESLSMREAALNVITEAYHQTIVPAKDADYCKGCPENCKFYD